MKANKIILYCIGCRTKFTVIHNPALLTYDFQIEQATKQHSKRN